MLCLSAEYSVSICVLITTSPTIYFSIKMRSMAETYGHLLPLVRTTCLRRPVVSATVCFVSVLKHTVIYFRLCAQHVCADRLIQLPFVSLQRQLVSVINSLSDSALNSALSLNEFFEFDFISALLGNYYEFFYAVNYVLQE